MTPCRYSTASKGGCDKGSSCRFAHDVNSLAQVSTVPAVPSTREPLTLSDLGAESLNTSKDGRSTIACIFFLQGSCRKENACQFAHNINSLSLVSITPTLPKSLDVLGLSDRKGELHTSKDRRSKIPCSFHLQGNCRKGNACPFAHPWEPSAAMNDPTNVDIDESKPENFTRELYGTIAHFEDGGQVSKVSLPLDFSAARINGLPPDSSPESVVAILSALGFEVPVPSVRTIRQDCSVFMSADVRVEDPNFSSNLCKRLDLEKATGINYSQLQAIPVVTNILSESTAHRVDCRKVVCSWYKSFRTAWLNFGREDIAERVRDNFNSGSYKVNNRVVPCDLPSRSAGRNNPFAWTLVLKELPGTTTEKEITRAIKDPSNKPRHIELGDPSSHTTNMQASAAVKSMLLQIGPLDSWEASEDWGLKRMKAKARFQEEGDARVAVRRLNLESLPFLKNGKLSIQLITSAKFKTPTNIYDTVKPRIDAEDSKWTHQHIHLKVYRNTDLAQIFTVLKIEGEIVRDVAKAKDSLERILAGTVALDGDVPLWSASFNNGSGYRKLKHIQESLGVLIIRNQKKSRLHLYGPPEKCEEAQRVLVDIVKTDSSTVHVIELGLNEFWRMKHGGFQRIVSALGKDVAAVDTVTTPKRILITGSTRDYQTALAIVNGQQPEEAKAEKENDKDCAVCWTEAENPHRTECNHFYCLECFDNLCFSTASGEKGFSIRCQGDMGKCDVIFSLDELQDHLSSSAFEDILEASFASYIRRRPHIFRYCPTPDCRQVYHTNIAAKFHTCPKCVTAICTSCHNTHDGLTCAEFKYNSSGENEAFERLKKEQGFKDCPRCKTTMEKTQGCNHMTCTGCGIHICWVCLETFSASELCYKHMNRKHGGIGY